MNNDISLYLKGDNLLDQEKKPHLIYCRKLNFYLLDYLSYDFFKNLLYLKLDNTNDSHYHLKSIK